MNNKHKIEGERTSSFELLRILAILAIIGYHFYFHTMETKSFSESFLNNLSSLPSLQGKKYQMEIFFNC